MNTIVNTFSPYSPLDTRSKQIRLLLLHAGPRSADLVCSIIVTSLEAESHEEYEAVSYCWGDVTDQVDIMLNDHRFTVTKSAECALRAFRQHDYDRTIWLDAICINQQDQAERGAQVSIMKDIYKAAVRALVWFGEDDGSFGLACELLTALVRQMRDQIDGLEPGNAQAMANTIKDFEWDSSRQMIDIRTHGIPTYDSAAWGALESFFNRPWFTRTWVIQEIVLSQRPIAFCGDHRLEWVIVEMAASWITHQRYAERSQRTGLLSAKNLMMVWLFAKKSSLESLLLVTKVSQATDPRDKIYGLLGIATDCASDIPAALKPDYSKSTSRVYSDATKYMIRADRNLDVLSQIGYVAPFETSGETNRSVFPSWVPRWDGTPRETMDKQYTTAVWGRVQKPFAASGSSRIDLPLNVGSDDPTLLMLSGMRVDKITRLSSTITSEEVAKSNIAATLWSDYVSDWQTYPTGEQLSRAFSLTLVADTTLNKKPASEDSRHDLDFAAFSSESHNPPSTDPPQGDRMRYGAAATNALLSRSFCTTEAGWMGICPPTARPGDLICLLFGGKVLYVVRREREHSVFVGECYIHGRMDGSALEQQLRTCAPAECFSLR